MTPHQYRIFAVWRENRTAEERRNILGSPQLALEPDACSRFSRAFLSLSESARSMSRCMSSAIPRHHSPNVLAAIWATRSLPFSQQEQPGQDRQRLLDSHHLILCCLLSFAEARLNEDERHGGPTIRLARNGLTEPLFGRNRRKWPHRKCLKAKHLNFQIEVAFALGLIFHVAGGAYGNSYLGCRRL
jgi:hypothetical protein